MRRLNKHYPYQKPSKNRSSKNLNLILGPASVFPAYTKWGDEQLIKRASQCKNKEHNVFIDELNARKKERKENAARKAAKAAAKA